MVYMYYLMYSSLNIILQAELLGETEFSSTVYNTGQTVYFSPILFLGETEFTAQGRRW